MTILIAEAMPLSFHIQLVELAWLINETKTLGHLPTEDPKHTLVGYFVRSWELCAWSCVEKWMLHGFEIIRENVYMWFACHHFLVVNGHLTWSSHFLQFESWYWLVPLRNAWFFFFFKWFTWFCSLYFLKKNLPLSLLSKKFIWKSLTRSQQTYLILGGMKVWKFKRMKRISVFSYSFHSFPFKLSNKRMKWILKK